MVFLRQIRQWSNRLNSYRITTYAASASFFLLTSLLPLLMLVLSTVQWVGLEIDSTLAEEFSLLMPEALKSVLDFIVQNLENVGIAEFSLSAVALLWSASQGMLGLIDGLNTIAGSEKHHGFIFKRLLCLLYMAVLVAGLLLTLGLRVFGHTILAFLQKYLPYVGMAFAEIMAFRGVTLYLIITLIIALIYTLFPNKKMHFVKQLPGAALSAAAWLIFSELYSLYINYISSASAIYGSMGVILLAMLWVYFCVYIIFIGAVINRTYPELTTTTIDSIKRICKRIFVRTKAKST